MHFLIGDDFRERRRDNLALLQTNQHASLSFVELLDCRRSEPACQDAVECAWAAAALDVTQDGRAHIKPEPFAVFGKIRGQLPGVEFSPFGDDDDGVRFSLFHRPFRSAGPVPPGRWQLLG